MEDRGQIWACDRAAKRLQRLEQNLQRLQLQSITTHVGDSRNLAQFTEIADRVLLDAPCSGLGTLHRRPDIRWRQQPEKLEELSQLQGELLKQAANWVKPGGILVYATCTLNLPENEQVVQAFLDNYPTWQLQPPSPHSPAAAFLAESGWLKIWPHRHQMDGFFLAKLKKG
jgi:16S rRNA (cytosine967-C5)-methyltransferase